MSTDSLPADPRSLHPHLDRANYEGIDTERAVLGAMMLNADVRNEVTRILGPKDFYRESHAVIWDAITYLFDHGHPAEPITVSAELERRGTLAAIGGGAYLHTLIETVPTAANAVYYAEEVKKLAIKRTFAEEGKRVIQLADSGLPADELEHRIAESYETCAKAAEGPNAAEARPVGEDQALMDEFIAGLGKRPESAFSTGIADLDRAMTARDGALILLSADTGVGKSLLAAQIARHYARDRAERVLFHSLEMMRDEMVERDIAAVSNVSLSEINGTHDLTPTDHDLIVNEYVPAYQEWASRLHYVQGRCGVSDVMRNARRIGHEHRDEGGVGLIVLDYLQISERPSGVSIERDDLALAAMTSTLKDLAMELNCIVICISQFSNEGAKASTPKTHHLKGSSALGQDADVVALMNDPSREDESRGGEIDVHLPKVRKGVSGTSVTLSERRHKGYFTGLGNSRSELSAAERVESAPPEVV